jgi:alanyl-tRNA synthetase
MNTLTLYEMDSYIAELDSLVTTVSTEPSGRPYALLTQTIFYPEAGGQPGDRGWIADSRVTEVRLHHDELRHYLEQPVGAGPARIRIDWDRRFDLMQQHTGQHLLTAVAQDRFNWETTAFHLGEDRSDIELNVARLEAQDLQALETAAMEEVRAAHPVTAWKVSPETLAALHVRSRGLPAGHTGEVRLVQIAGLDINTCGGTHLRNTSEIESIKLLGTEPMRGGTRLYFLAGSRVRQRLGRHESRLAELRNLLGAPDERLAEVLTDRLEQLKQASRREKQIREEMALSLAEALANRKEEALYAHYESADLPFLQRLARLLCERAPAKSALLTAGADPAGFFVLFLKEGESTRLNEVGRQVASLLDGRGGGADRLYQGKAAAVSKGKQALALLESVLSGEP